MSVVCLQALNDQDDTCCSQLIQAGRYGIMQQLANAGTESIARSNPLIVQLQLLTAVAEAQKALCTSHNQAGDTTVAVRFDYWILATDPEASG